MKQAPRQCYQKFDRFIVSSDFTKLKADHCCYSKWSEKSYIMLLLYIDDMLVARSSIEKIVNLKASMAKEFSIKDLGLGRKILGIRISREKRGC